MKKISIITCIIFIPYFLYADLVFDTTLIETKLREDSPSCSFKFHYKNTSKYSIKILDVKTACGCTVVTDKEKNVQPLSEGILAGKFLPNGSEQTYEKYLYVLTNDLGQSEIKLTLKVKIVPIITFSKKMLLWRLGDNSTKVVNMSISDKKFKVKSITCESKNFDIKLYHKDEHELKLSITPFSTEIKQRVPIKICLISDNSDRIYNLFLLII